MVVCVCVCVLGREEMGGSLIDKDLLQLLCGCLSLGNKSRPPLLEEDRSWYTRTYVYTRTNGYFSLEMMTTTTTTANGGKGGGAFFSSYMHNKNS